MCRRFYAAITHLLSIGVFLIWTNSLSAQDKLYVSGYGNVHYMDHDGTPNIVGAASLDDGFFQLREFSLFFDFVISDAIIASTEIEAGDNGTRYTANYAYVDIQALESLGFRAGKFLVPFLSYNENKPNFKQHLMSQPFTAWNLAPVNGVALDFGGFGWSDSGIMANWNGFLGEWGFLDLKLALINGLGSDTAALDANTLQLDAGAVQPVIRPRDGLIQNERNNDLRDNNSDKASVVKVTFKSEAYPADIGLSWYRGDWDRDSKEGLMMVGGHLNWLAKNWSLKGEYAIADVEQEAGFDPVAGAGKMGPAAINTTTGDYRMKAWYAEASYVPWRQSSGEEYLRLVVRYDDVDTNDEIPFTPFDRARLTLGAEYEIAFNSRLRYEWQRATIDDFDRAPAPYRGAGGKEHIQMHMASVIFAF